MPAPLHFYRPDDQKENAKKVSSTVEGFDHKQLCDWIEKKFFGGAPDMVELAGPGDTNRQTSIPLDTPNILSDDEEEKTKSSSSDQRRNTVSKSKKIWGTSHEKEQVFRTVLKVIRKSTKLKGADIVLREPSTYVTKLLMPVYRKMVANSNDEDDQKQATRPRSKRDAETEALRLSIIGLIRDEGILNRKIEDSISDQELGKILSMRMAKSLLGQRGLSPKEIKEKLFGNAAPSSFGNSVLEVQDFVSVMWRLRQSAFMETKHSVGALIDNPYCVYIWVYFRKKPNYHYAVQQTNDNVFIPLRPCLDTTEVHLYYGKYFARSNPLELDISFYLCEKNNETAKFAWLKVDNEWVRFNSVKRKHIVIRAYNEGIGQQQGSGADSSIDSVLLTAVQTPRQDCVQKVKDMKDWKSLGVNKSWAIGGKKGSNLPYFECLLQFCFTNIGLRVPLSACIHVIESMTLMQTRKGKGDESLEMITEKVEAQKRWIRSFNEQNDRSWYSLIKFMFHLYWIPYINHSEHTSLFDHNMKTMDILQHLLSGEYGLPKRAISILRTIMQPVAESFIKDIVRAIDRTQQDISRRYQYLLWYNLINSICFKGNFDSPPNLIRNVPDCNFEAEFIRMIQIDVNINIITRVERMQPLEKEGFWILCTAMRGSNDEGKFQIYNKMCCILSVFQSRGYSEALIKCKAEIHLILSGQRRPLEAAIGLYHMLRPENNKDIASLVDVIADFVLELDPSRQKNAIYKLVELMATDKKIATHRQLIECIGRNTRIRWREELIPYLVPTLKAITEKNRALREAVFDEFWLNHDLLKMTQFLIGEHGLPIETFNKLIKEHPERISREYFDDWLEIIGDKNVKQTIKLKIAEHPPLTYRRCLAEGNAETERLLDLLEMTLLTAPSDAKSDKPLMSNYMNVVCNVIMESFLAVETIYYNCHDAEIDSLQMINYFYCDYGMHCVEYCHRLLKHEKGVKITYCKKLIDNFIGWWQMVKQLIAEAQMKQKIIDHLIGGATNVYDIINKMYDTVGGPVDQKLDAKVEENITKYREKQQIQGKLELFFTHFAPQDASMWGKTIKVLNERMRTIVSMDVQKVMKMDWSWYAPYRSFFENLMKDSGSGIFKNFWDDFIEEATDRWRDRKGLCYKDLDTVDMCLWLESRDWLDNQWQTVYQLQDIFIREKIDGSILHQAIQSGSNEVTLFASKLGSDDQNFRRVLGLLFLDLEKKATFKWQRQYSMSMLKVMYNERIKPQWDLFRRQLKDGECKVYDIQRHFLFGSPWNIETQKIHDEVNKMRLNDDDDLPRARSIFKQKSNSQEVVNGEVINDVLKCLQCIQGMTRAKIVIDTMKVFQGVLSKSKRFEECKEDKEHQTLQWAIQTETKGFTSGTVHEKVHSNSDAIRVNVIKLLTLQFDSELKLNALLSFWEKHKDMIGETKCQKKEYLRWLETITANKKFVDELFEQFEKDEDFAGHLKLFQDPDPKKSQRLVQLNYIRKQLVNEIAVNISGKTMSEMMSYLLKDFSSQVGSKDINKLEALIESWSDIKSNNQSVTSLKFHKDRALLARLQAFRFDGTELYIDLKPAFVEKENEDEDDEMKIDIEPPNSGATKPSHKAPGDPDSVDDKKIAITPPVSTTETASLSVPGDPNSMEAIKKKSTNYGSDVELPESPAMGSVSQPQHVRFEAININKPNLSKVQSEEEELTMTSEEFVSLHDRLLIYTSSGQGTAVPDHLLNVCISSLSEHILLCWFHHLSILEL